MDGTTEKNGRLGMGSGQPISTSDALVLLNAPLFLRKRDLNTFWRYAKRLGKLLPYLDCVKIFQQYVPVVVILDVPRRQKKDVLRVIPAVVGFLKTGLGFLLIETQPVNIGFREYPFHFKTTTVRFHFSVKREADVLCLFLEGCNTLKQLVRATIETCFKREKFIQDGFKPLVKFFRFFFVYHLSCSFSVAFANCPQAVWGRYTSPS
jgi:hypothetical protein